jgi:hypothetical protein
VAIRQDQLYKLSTKIIAWQLNHNVEAQKYGYYDQQIIILDEMLTFRILG